MCECITFYGKLVHSKDCPERKKNQHKWHKEIKAWAEGAIIERLDYRSKRGWYIDYSPTWSTHDEVLYRIKPEPKPLSVQYGYAHQFVGGVALTERRYPCDNLKFTFDGDTGELKNAEVI